LVDIDKLNWVSSNTIKNTPSEVLYEKLLTYLEKYDLEFFKIVKSFPDIYNLKIVSELKTKIRKFSEYKENTFFLYDESKIPSTELLVNQKMKIDDLETAKN